LQVVEAAAAIPKTEAELNKPCWFYCCKTWMCGKRSW